MQRGLMFVEDMPDDEGMIFLYPCEYPLKFWMKNTLIPLDMLFFDATNTLRYIEYSAQPHDETPRGPENILTCTVVEINGGLAKEMGIVRIKLLSDLPQECLQPAPLSDIKLSNFKSK